MSQRIGNYGPQDVNRALLSVAQADSSSNLKRIIAEQPIISEPYFHAILRQEYIKLINQHSPYLESFTNRYYDLFTLLHYKTYYQLCGEVKPATPGPFHPSVIFAPPFFAELARLLGDKIPASHDMPLHPEKNFAQIEQDVVEAINKSVSLSAYAPLTGSSWSGVIVECPACRRRWITWRAYAVDLLQAPQLGHPLQAGQINHSACPTCVEETCIPLAVWIQDGPGTNDPLAALSCIWRLTPSVFTYQPPPSTPRIEKNDRILEIRCSELKDRLEWPEIDTPPSAGDAKMVTMTVSYTLDDLLRYMADIANAEQFSQEMMIAEISGKIKSGILPFYQADADVRKMVALAGANWLLSNPGYPANRDKDTLIEFLVNCLIAEGIAEAQHRPLSIRVLLAAITVQSWLMLGEVGLAEAALARSEDLMSTVPADDPQQSLAETAMSGARAEVYDRIKSPQEANQQRAQVRSFLAGNDTLLYRMTDQQEISNQALSLYETKQYAEALNVYPECVAALKGMLMEAQHSQNPDERQLTQVIQHTLSGDLSNWATVLTDLAEHLDTYQMFSSLPAAVRDVFEARTGPSVAAEYVKPALPTLKRIFSFDVTPAMLLDQAQQLLREALQLSEAVEGWEFAGIQAHRLASLLDKNGKYDEAKAMIEKTLQYSARAGDHTRVWTGLCYLADRAMKKNDGQEGLEYLEKAAREWIREKVGSGFHVAFGEDIVVIGNAALQTVAMGADAVRAVAVVESLKAATTAASLVKGMPVQPSQKDQPVLTGHLQGLIQQREELRLQAFGDPNDHKILDQLKQKQADVEQERQNLSLRDPRFGNWINATDIDLTDSQALLNELAHFGEKTTLMGLLVVQDQVWSYMVWQGGSLVNQQPLPAQVTADGAAQNGATLDRSLLPDENSQKDMLTADAWEMDFLEKLAEAILTPFEKRLAELGPEDRLIISPSGALSRVPFAALPYQNLPLCKHVNINLIQGIGVLEACLARPVCDFQSVLCIGGPTRPNLQDLPGAQVEAQQIKALYTGLGKESQVYTGTQATVQAFKSCVSHFDAIHIACHAKASGYPDDLSVLMLSPDPTNQDSGNLTEDRILFEILLKPGCFVNLAGCSTGTQTEMDAPLLGGLIPAFLIAGAASVLGSLWPIGDLTAVRFQTEFFRQLLAENSPVVSLAKTQRKCIDGELGKEMQPPSIWAGFAVYGAG